MPVGPSYEEVGRVIRETRLGSEAKPLTETGRVCGTSASSAPSVTTICVPTASATSTINCVNVRQRIDGSAPLTRIRSRGARGTRTSERTTSGHSSARAPDSSRVIFGRVAWKS